MSRRTVAAHMKGERGRRKRVRLAERDGARCFYCRTPFADPAAQGTFDHYMPWALWPTNCAFNLVLACDPCNTVKADHLPVGLLLLLWPLLDRGRLELVA
ncbi:HNH endonuclease [Streptomyces sp. NPDC102365]|uniref:HNH endonuclease n=1 Tax=Streptomyces sp. NPDC102365 TaxID=3366162 RepID=UPI003805C861